MASGPFGTAVKATLGVAVGAAIVNLTVATFRAATRSESKDHKEERKERKERKRKSTKKSKKGSKAGRGQAAA